jgi:hypothetical protein
MRDRGDHYEYISVYVGDLIICTKEPKVIIDALQTEHQFKLKGTGPVKFQGKCATRSGSERIQTVKWNTGNRWKAEFLQGIPWNRVICSDLPASTG